MDFALEGIVKHFDGTVANACVDLRIGAGEVVALLGESGAGKSTLMKVAYGFIKPDAGRIYVNRQAVTFDSPRDAARHGVGMVFQQLSLIDALTVAENLALTQPNTPFALLPRRLGGAWMDQAMQRLKSLAPQVEPDRSVGTLSLAEKQMIELAKVLGQDASLIILDEPTSLLARPEAEELWRRVRELAAEGKSVILITHKLDDVEACADRVCIMRHGRMVAELADPKDRATIVSAMIGETKSAPRTGRARLGPVRLTVRNLSARRATTSLNCISFDVRGGEVLGIAGVMGNAQELLGAVLAGVQPATEGTVLLDARDISADDSKAHIAYIAEEPATSGSATRLTAAMNLQALNVRSLPWYLTWGEYTARARQQMLQFDVRPSNPEMNAGAFSGGNLQKLVTARELARDPALVIAVYPSMGLDVAATSAVVQRLLKCAESGAAVVWISEDVDPLLEYADRVAVIHAGRIVGQGEPWTLQRQQLGAWMSGAA